MADSPTSALQQILPVLNRSSVPYVIIGAVASGILGRPRATLDVDILVGGGSQGLAKISSLIEKIGGEKLTSFLEANPMLRGIMIRMRMGLIEVGRGFLEELILGADFFQRWKMRLNPENEDIVLDQDALKLKLV